MTVNINKTGLFYKTKDINKIYNIKRVLDKYNWNYQRSHNGHSYFSYLSLTRDWSLQSNGEYWKIIATFAIWN